MIYSYIKRNGAQESFKKMVIYHGYILDISQECNTYKNVVYPNSRKRRKNMSSSYN